MAEDYNGKLITRFYRAIYNNEQNKITDMIKEMEEIAAPIFLPIICNEYYKFKKTYISHYFVGALSSFDIDEVVIIAKKIANDENIKDIDFIYLLPILIKHKIFDTKITKRSEKLFLENMPPNKKKYEFGDSYDIGSIMRYLDKANILEKYEDLIKTNMSKEHIIPSIIELLVYYFLRFKPIDDQFKYIIENYEKIKNDQLDIAISKEIIGWKGPLVQRLKDKIYSSGCSRAKDILNESKIEKDKEEKRNIQKEEEIMGNLQVVNDIVGVRKQINLKSKLMWNFELLLQAEALLKQQKSASDEIALEGYCIEFRSIIQCISSDTKNHGIESSEALKYLPGVEEKDLRLSLNQLSLFLFSKGIDAKDIISNLKELNGVTSLLAHPEVQLKLVKKLTKLNLNSEYQSKEWAKFHNSLLNKYKNILKELLLILEKHEIAIMILREKSKQ